LQVRDLFYCFGRSDGDLSWSFGGEPRRFGSRVFPSISEVGECSSCGESSGGQKTDGKGIGGSSWLNHPVIRQPIHEEDFISPGMFRLAKSEDCEWRRRQAAEVREMPFRTPQPRQMREVIEEMDTDVMSSEIHELEVASRELEESLMKLKSLMKKPIE
jgi:hypothetical protein